MSTILMKTVAFLIVTAPCMVLGSETYSSWMPQLEKALYDKLSTNFELCSKMMVQKLNQFYSMHFRDIYDAHARSRNAAEHQCSVIQQQKPNCTCLKLPAHTEHFPPELFYCRSLQDCQMNKELMNEIIDLAGRKLLEDPSWSEIDLSESDWSTTDFLRILVTKSLTNTTARLSKWLSGKVSASFNAIQEKVVEGFRKVKATVPRLNTENVIIAAVASITTAAVLILSE